MSHTFKENWFSFSQQLSLAVALQLGIGVYVHKKELNGDGWEGRVEEGIWEEKTNIGDFENTI